MRSLAVLLVALTGLLVFEGCGSDSPSSGKKAQGNNAMCTAATYCPMVNNLPGCCVTNLSTCGVQMQGGCVPLGGKTDAGAK